eukprot:g20528.t1
MANDNAGGGGVEGSDDARGEGDSRRQAARVEGAVDVGGGDESGHASSGVGEVGMDGVVNGVVSDVVDRLVRLEVEGVFRKAVKLLRQRTRDMAGVGLVRLGKELKMLTDEPPPGVCAWPVDDCMTHLQAQIQGPEDTPYERGTFLLDLQIPDRYPFEPPKVRFVTPIYHPNIDSGGRICLDTLKMRPAGSWAPSMNVPTLLTTIRLLMAHPNGDDGLMPDITELFLKNPSRFADVARAHVEEHARQDTLASSKKADAKAKAKAQAALEGSTTGDEAGAEKGRDSLKVAKGAVPVPVSSVDERPNNRSAEKGADGGDGGTSSEAAADAQAATAAIAGKMVGGRAPGGSAAPEAPDKGEKTACVAATPAVDGARGGDAYRGGAGEGSNADARNSGGGGGGGGGRSSGCEREESRTTGGGADGASSDDGAWSESDDEDNDGDGGGPLLLMKKRGMSASEAVETFRLAAGTPEMRELLVACRRRVVEYVRGSPDLAHAFTDGKDVDGDADGDTEGGARSNIFTTMELKSLAEWEEAIVKEGSYIDVTAILGLGRIFQIPDVRVVFEDCEVGLVNTYHPNYAVEPTGQPTVLWSGGNHFEAMVPVAHDASIKASAGNDTASAMDFCLLALNRPADYSDFVDAVISFVRRIPRRTGTVKRVHKTRGTRKWTRGRTPLTRGRASRFRNICRGLRSIRGGGDGDDSAVPSAPAAPVDAGSPPAAPGGWDDMDASETPGASVAPAFDGAIPSAPADSPVGENGGGPDEDTPEDRDAMDVSEAPEANPAPPTTSKL